MHNNWMKSCSRCLLDSHFPGIKFNRDNVCSERLAFDKIRYFMNYFGITEQHIDDAIKKAKNLDAKLLNRFGQLMRMTYFRTGV